jgi:ketosteroid isomerase-like protein
VAALVLTVVMVGAAGPPSLAAAEREATSVQSHIWELERNYLRHLQDEDLSGLADFWHEGFVGWPSHATAPVDRATAAASVSTLLDSVRIVSFELHPLMIRVIGNVAVVHYRLDWEIEDADGSSSTVSYRITHTWLEENGKWRILTGMSSAVATR